MKQLIAMTACLVAILCSHTHAVIEERNGTSTISVYLQRHPDIAESFINIIGTKDDRVKSIEQAVSYFKEHQLDGRVCEILTNVTNDPAHQHNATEEIKQRFVLAFVQHTLRVAAHRVLESKKEGNHPVEKVDPLDLDRITTTESQSESDRSSRSSSERDRPKQASRPSPVAEANARHPDGQYHADEKEISPMTERETTGAKSPYLASHHRRDERRYEGEGILMHVKNEDINFRVVGSPDLKHGAFRGLYIGRQ